ncbi:DUF3304 domain-containing protein [Paraburkholderia sp. SOS3]|uniref:DUF3304 domain-containing protein n=1 Tax=Paraburkholderia sp. SOS3 TaxID=1926494 RepID=UPI00094781D6|nr:DUF3304 domain-containing protein [Paraburkholderia sp. SOS3]APR34947.1 hypothetical protein BTO02_05375 [Paraburkholderia sp. SOS3]
MKRIVLLLIGVGIGALMPGCKSAGSGEDVLATAWSANYTEDYIYDFRIRKVSGKDTGLEGIQVKEFSRGGTGSSECCSTIPRVGQQIEIVWRVGNYRAADTDMKTFNKTVVVTGTMPKKTLEHSVLIVRFFQNHEAEAELIPGDGDFGPSNQRIDKLFFAVPRVMRAKGE